MRVDFYLLPPSDDDERQRCVFACRLAEKAYRQRLTIWLRTSGDEDAGRLDDLLWTFRQGSFVPHAPSNIRASCGNPPVWVGARAAPEPTADLIINLADDIPAEATGHARVAEIIRPGESARQSGRRRYRQYQALGTQPEIHDLTDARSDIPDGH